MPPPSLRCGGPRELPQGRWAPCATICACRGQRGGRAAPPALRMAPAWHVCLRPGSPGVAALEERGPQEDSLAASAAMGVAWASRPPQHMLAHNTHKHVPTQTHVCKHTHVHAQTAMQQTHMKTYAQVRTHACACYTRPYTRPYTCPALLRLLQPPAAPARAPSSQQQRGSGAGLELGAHSKQSLCPQPQRALRPAPQALAWGQTQPQWPRRPCPPGRAYAGTQ